MDFMCDGQVETTLATASNFLQSGGPKLLSSENSSQIIKNSNFSTACTRNDI